MITLWKRLQRVRNRKNDPCQPWRHWKKRPTIAVIYLKEREVKLVEEEARSGVVKVVCQTERGDREKDRVESEIAVATFAELVSVTSELCWRLRNVMKRLWLFIWHWFKRQLEVINFYRYDFRSQLTFQQYE